MPDQLPIPAPEPPPERWALPGSLGHLFTPSASGTLFRCHCGALRWTSALVPADDRATSLDCLYAGGRRVEIPAHHRPCPVCGNDRSECNPEAHAAEARFDRGMAGL